MRARQLAQGSRISEDGTATSYRAYRSPYPVPDRYRRIPFSLDSAGKVTGIGEDYGLKTDYHPSGDKVWQQTITYMSPGLRPLEFFSLKGAEKYEAKIVINRNEQGEIAGIIEYLPESVNTTYISDGDVDLFSGFSGSDLGIEYAWDSVINIPLRQLKPT